MSKAEAPFQPAGQALWELDNPVVSLDPSQAVCAECHLVFWVPLGHCPNH